MASINASAHSDDLGVSAIAISQQLPSDIIANSGHHSLTSHILRRVDHSESETYVNQGHDNKINMITQLPRDVHGLRSQRDITSVEDPGHVSTPKTPARSAITRQIAGFSMHDPVSQALVDFAMDRDTLTQRSQDSASMHLYQHHDSNQSTLFTQPLQSHQSASTSPGTPYKSSNMFSREPQFDSYRNQEAYNRRLSHMTSDVLRSQHDIGHQESYNEQRTPSSMERSLLRSNYGLSMHQTRSRMEIPRNIEALNRQTALLTTRDVQIDWQNGLQAGSRPAFWDQCRQNFGISQQFQAEPSARKTPSDFRTTTTVFPQPHLRPDSFRFQQWPSSVDESVRLEPFFNSLYHTTPDMPSQAQQAAYQSVRNHIQLHQSPVLSAPLSVGQTGPAAMHTLPSVIESSDFSSQSPISSSSEILPKAASDDLYATKQPPIGTPRAAGPKLAFEPTIEQSQATDNELTLSSLPYYPGSDIMYPYVKENPSEALRRLTAPGRPSIDQLLDTDIVPFMKGNENSRTVDWGVIRIGNIPYSLTRAEVVSFLGSNAKVIPPALGTGVHIIMERTTGKTMDCYVEFQSVYEAQIAVNHLVYRGHALRLGHPPHDRVVNVTMSSQDELMKQLFPRAKNVVWVDGKPVIQASNEPFNTGFKTFITGEELVMMCKHAEQPHRSSYIQRCPQRTYECMISTLAKFPWYAVDHYTLGTREQIFNTARDMLRHLVYFLKRGGLSNVNHHLLFEYMITGLNAAGFSERQRWELVQAAEHAGQSIRISPLSQWWPWEALGRRAGIEEDVVRYYARLITLHPTLQATATDAEAANPFGGSVEHDSVEITLAEAATKEWELFEAILRDVLRQSQSALNN